MKEYLRWCFRYFYLLLFWPTKLRREADANKNLAQRLRLMHWKLMPWIVALVLTSNFGIGKALERCGLTFHWGASWIGAVTGWLSLSMGVGLGILFGVKVSAAFGGRHVKALVRVFGVVFGAAFGLAFSVVSGLLGDIAACILFGALTGVLWSVMGSQTSAWSGLLLGLIMGLALSSYAIFLPGTLVLTAIVSYFLAYFRLATYPLDLILTVAIYYVARRHLVKRVWWYCPVAWNELIWLPLPFVADLLIMLVRQDREEGFKQIAFVVAERKLQRRAARAALVAVALDDLQARSLTTLPKIAEQLNWTTDTPADLPDEVITALPRFNRVAERVGQYFTLTSMYRKSEALTRANAETDALQRSLILARGRYAPRLLKVANEWRGLLDEESKRANRLMTVTREIPNAFVYGPPVVETEHNVFTGRGDVVRQIEASVLGATQVPTLLLHGPRRMGKTSILNQLPRMLGPDFAPTIVDCQNPAVTGSVSTLLRYLSRELSQGLRRRLAAIEPLTAAALDREPFAVFDDWLETLERAMPAGMRALLCLDEYERLQATLDAGWGGLFLDVLRHTLQHRPRVILMFIGAHTFQELGPAWTDRFISARRLRISFLTTTEVLPLLTQPIPEFDMTYAPGALEAIIAATNCQPFLTQATAFELVQLLNEQERKQAMPNDVEVAIARALVSGGEYFANVWSDAGEEGQAILGAIVRGEPPPDFSAACAWLHNHDVLNSHGEFAVDMVRRWVKIRCL